MGTRALLLVVAVLVAGTAGYGAGWLKWGRETGPNRPQVTVTLVDYAGEPVRGATVAVFFWPEAGEYDHIAHGRTDEDGNFVFSVADHPRVLAHRTGEGEVELYVKAFHPGRRLLFDSHLLFAIAEDHRDTVEPTLRVPPDSAAAFDPHSFVVAPWDTTEPQED